ncbi:hypothetical protein NQ318_009880 [Aromia moschata]|uniref:U1-type domain-containing protein n=1 Tax=Aromia moschata TaxID=1265417 RepID=A0AAV8Y3S2_9CUCU|nr:hypothetical protein NQ318_009880 [Aromia moschata]
MYNNSTHYPNSAYPQSAYPQYQQNYGTTYGYPNYGSQYPSQICFYQSNQPAPPGESFSSEGWMPSTSTNYGASQKDAVVQEMQQQKAQLIKQREDYVKKVSVLRHELEQLRMQKQELIGEGTPDRDLGNILRENDKLQEEIQGKMKAIHNVIEMLSSIIKDGRSISDLEASLVDEEASKSPPAPKFQVDSYSNAKGKSPEAQRPGPEKYCYVHYDTGLHWCRLCDEFPDTAKDLLLHLQDKKHREMAKENDVDNTPWHKLPSEPILPSDENAPKKRIPIKGLQFFISAPSWYCKLCDVWIGDLHCASHHLKSQTHYQNYENFVVQNPHWEVEWLKDREKAMARNGLQDSSDSDAARKKKRRAKKRMSVDFIMAKEKKKKKRSKRRKKQSSDSSSSSSSSDSSSDDEKADRSRSIRVAMRNMKQVQSIMEEDLTSKWSVLEKLVEEHKKNEEKREKEREKEKEKGKEPEDPLINQWMTVSQPHEKDKRLLENLKDRMKQKQEVEKTRQLEMERKKREKEREEREEQERKEREARVAAEEAERERKRKEVEEYERIRDKERNQVRFKTNYRRRRTPSRSDDEESPHGHYKEERGRYRRSQSRSHESVRRSLEKSRSRSRSPEHKQDHNNAKKKPPGPPSYKKLPFIGRMPLFKNKKMEEKEEKKEIKKESYEPQRRTRFQPGNLARAFIPKPDVVCFPKLSSIPPLTIPPPPVVSQRPAAPEPPKISKQSPPKAPPPPKIALKEEPPKAMHLSDDEMLYADPGEGADPTMMSQYYQTYGDMVYPPHSSYEYAQAAPETPDSVRHAYTMPLQPPPLPPDDDLALLGICADDMAAQTF